MSWSKWMLEVAGLGSLLIASVSCDGYVRARFKILSNDGSPLGGAVVRRGESEEHDLARVSSASGCADFGGVVAPFFDVPVRVTRADTSR